MTSWKMSAAAELAVHCLNSVTVSGPQSCMIMTDWGRRHALTCHYDGGRSLCISSFSKMSGDFVLVGYRGWYCMHNYRVQTETLSGTYGSNQVYKTVRLTEV